MNVFEIPVLLCLIHGGMESGILHSHLQTTRVGSANALFIVMKKSGFTQSRQLDNLDDRRFLCLLFCLIRDRGSPGSFMVVSRCTTVHNLIDICN